ncbi:MAG: Fis family transcriptional regulator, partial [Gammaproteobacteria bacterium]|nr:Fis family transcriptional regulator [Gammaproteobacteria bacterium]
HSHASGQPFAETECPITQVLRKGQTHRGKNEIMWHKDGSSFHAEYISTPIIEGDDITGAVVVVRRAPTPTTPNIQ